MVKKIILTVTTLFLLFEILYFDSNNKLNDVKENASDLVYKIELNDDNRQEFLSEYANIILENSDNKVMLLTDKNMFDEIKEKYDFVIE